MILRFTGKYFFLSNMYSCTIKLSNVTFPSAEHAFQAFKCVNTEDFNKILNCKSSKLARKLGRQVRLRSDWEQVKDQIMFEVVKAKFMQNLDLANKLINTYPKILVEGNTWKDTYWGVDLFRHNEEYKYGYCGRNKLGEILMQIRGLLRNRKEK